VDESRFGDESSFGVHLRSDTRSHPLQIIQQVSLHELIDGARRQVGAPQRVPHLRGARQCAWNAGGVWWGLLVLGVGCRAVLGWIGYRFLRVEILIEPVNS